MDRRLGSAVSVELFKAVFLLVLWAEEAEQNLLVRELKTMLQCSLAPLHG